MMVGILLGLVFSVSLACVPAFAQLGPRDADLRPETIVTVLPKDAIPAILAPKFQDRQKASWLNPKDLVVGVEIGGDSRAYPVPILSRHEIVNDKVGGISIAVTW
jgi:hypothetical protein